MHIAVCDDEPATLAYLSALVRRWGEGRADPVRVERFPSAQALWFEWEAKPASTFFCSISRCRGSTAYARA